MVTDQLSNIIVSLNDEFDSWNIRRFVETMPISDSKFLRKIYKQLVPALDLTQAFSCMSCGHIEDMEVPFNTEFSVKSPLSYYQYDVPSCEYEWHEDSNISIYYEDINKHKLLVKGQDGTEYQVVGHYCAEKSYFPFTM